MQPQCEPDLEAGDAKAAPCKRRPSGTRKVTVRITQELYERLVAATERPGVGKSMIVDAALEWFLNLAPSVEDLMRERFDAMNVRFDRLERDMRMLAETVALHARYHLAVMPPLPQSRQQEAVPLGDERFKVQAEQVDRRVRQCGPLMREMIDRFNATSLGKSEPTIDEDGPLAPEPRPTYHQNVDSRADIIIKQEPTAAAGEGGSNSNFRRLPN